MIATLFLVDLPSIPSYTELATSFGPYLGLVLTIVISAMGVQYRWYRTTLSAKDKEIERLVANNKELNDRLLYVYDDKSGFKAKPIKKKNQ